jgi:hypothetical protein
LESLGTGGIATELSLALSSGDLESPTYAVDANPKAPSLSIEVV